MPWLLSCFNALVHKTKPKPNNVNTWYFFFLSVSAIIAEYLPHTRTCISKIANAFYINWSTGSLFSLVIEQHNQTTCERVSKEFMTLQNYAKNCNMSCLNLVLEQMF